MRNRVKSILVAIFVVLICAFTIMLIFMYGCNSHKKAKDNNEETHNGMYVDGCSLRRSDGTPIVLRGINHAHTWYRSEDEVAFDAIADTEANCIRVVLSNGVLWDKDEASEVRKVLELAKEKDMIAILEVHDGTGDNSLYTIQGITDYWIDIADVLAGTEEYCIVNIANEWVGSWNSNIWKKGYIDSISKIREAGIGNVLMVDSAGWGQYGRSIRANGLEVFEADPNHNTMFSIHMYGMSGRYNWLIRYNLEGVTDQNLCVCVGEFGYTHSDGDVKEDYLMEYCYDNEIGTIAWSWKGNSGGVEYLDLSNDWEGDYLTPEWGQKVVNGEFGIRNTSQK